MSTEFPADLKRTQVLIELETAVLVPAGSGHLIHHDIIIVGITDTSDEACSGKVEADTSGDCIGKTAALVPSPSRGHFHKSSLIQMT